MNATKTRVIFRKEINMIFLNHKTNTIEIWQWPKNDQKYKKCKNRSNALSVRQVKNMLTIEFLWRICEKIWFFCVYRLRK